jgi:hypothetical protein
MCYWLVGKERNNDIQLKSKAREWLCRIKWRQKVGNSWSMMGEAPCDGENGGRFLVGKWWLLIVKDTKGAGVEYGIDAHLAIAQGNNEFGLLLGIATICK